jgi:hypothetical protein
LTPLKRNTLGVQPWESRLADPGLSPRAIRWLWFFGALFVWPAVFQAVSLVASRAVLGVEPTGTLLVGVIGAVAWGVAWLGFRLGAPRFIWVAVAVGSVPALAAMGPVLASTQSQAAARPEFALLALLGAVPPLVVFLESRRWLESCP